MVGWGGSRLVGRCRLVSGSRLVGCRGRLVGGGSLVDRSRGIGGLALILHVHHIAGVAISSVVGDNLGAAIREKDTVLAVGRVAITGLIGAKLNVGAISVLGINAVPVLVLGGGLLVGGLVVSGSGLVSRRGVGWHGRGRGSEGQEGDKGLQGMVLMTTMFERV